MPEQNGIGYSEHTPQKLEHLQAILAMHVAITESVWNRSSFWHNSQYHAIDATAGTGECPEYRLKGSPVLWLDILQRQNMPFRADFIEREEINYSQLCQRFDSHPLRHRIHIHNDEYQVVVPQLLRTTYDPLGLIFIDPSGDKPHLPTLELIAKERRYMEILCYLSASCIKRAAKRFPDIQEHQVSLFDYVGNIDKKFWLVREPMGKHQWTFLLGSNTDRFNDYKRIGFYRTDSARGREILTCLNYTREELAQWEQATLPLIEPMPNILRIPATGPYAPGHSNEQVGYANDASSEP